MLGVTVSPLERAGAPALTHGFRKGTPWKGTAQELVQQANEVNPAGRMQNGKGTAFGDGGGVFSEIWRVGWTRRLLR